LAVKEQSLGLNDRHLAGDLAQPFRGGQRLGRVLGHAENSTTSTRPSDEMSILARSSTTASTLLSRASLPSRTAAAGGVEAAIAK
jgi:hypothetical protein